MNTLSNNQSLSPCSTGLVYNSTSGKYPSRAELLKPNSHIVDSALNRIRKVGQSVKTTARLHQQETAESGFRFKPAMITCTYAPNQHWCKRDLSDLIHHCRKYLQRRYKETAFRYTWVAELQKRGVIHYHVILWLPKGCTLPKPDKQGWWTKGSTRIEWVKNAVGYLAKYASKGSEDGSKFPRGARISGFGGLSAISRCEYRYWRVPNSVRKVLNPLELFKATDFDLRKIIGGYFNKFTGEFIQGEFAFILLNGKPHVVQKKLLLIH